MPRYAPLPRVELDPRTEAELVSAAARRVYEASGATINDFSSGSPVMALLEGQAFAQSEFLQFANDFPESVLVEWIGPFLGAQRRTGSGALVDLTFTITARDEQFVVFDGFQVATDPNLTDGTTVDFVTIERLTIAPQETTGTVRAVSILRTSNANVPSNTITRSLTSLEGVQSITNDQPAYGGSDPELLNEVKERFFSLIRRRNPVSAEDWQDFFTDALGVGTSTTVLPRYSQGDVYSYDKDYISSNPAVGLFVLNPDGSPISTAQQDALENLAKWSCPVEFTPYIYPMQVDDLDVVAQMRYNPAKGYARNLKTFSRALRDSLNQVLRPNAVFPVDQDFSVNDLESALKSTFPFVFGSSNQYTDPEVDRFDVYHTPQMMGAYRFFDAKVKPFETGPRVRERDLVMEQGTISDNYFPALSSFDPTFNDKVVNVNLGNLNLTVIKTLEVSSYRAGDVISFENNLHVFRVDHDFASKKSVEELVNLGILSSEKSYIPWSSGTPYTTLDSFGNYDPQVIAFTEKDTNFFPVLPSPQDRVKANQLPGHPIYVVARDFVSDINTTSLGETQARGFVGSSPASVLTLVPGNTYIRGTYVKTPNAVELSTSQITDEYCYLDKTRGLLEKHAYVVKDFVYSPEDELGVVNVTRAYDELITLGAIQEVDVVPFTDCQGKSSFASKPFRYSARFFTGEYIRYREQGGFDSLELENCFESSGECTSERCQQLFEQNLPLPRYFFALKDFTPDDTDVDQMVDDKVLYEVAASSFKVDYVIRIAANQSVYSYSIARALEEQLDIATDSLTEGQRIQVLNEFGDERGVYVWDGQSTWTFISSGLPTHRDMFRYAPGDVVTIRNGSFLRSYRAVKHVTPITEIDVYFKSGVFVQDDLTETVKWVDPSYHLEDIIEYNVDGSKSYYRSTRSFTPNDTREVWYAGTVANTPRVEEFFKNTLKVVNMASCSNLVMSRLENHVGTTKLGNLTLKLQSKESNKVTDTLVWESTRFGTDIPSLSTSSLSEGSLSPVNYRDGTLAL